MDFIYKKYTNKITGSTYYTNWNSVKNLISEQKVEKLFTHYTEMLRFEILFLSL